MHFYGNYNGNFLWVSQVLFYTIQMHVKILMKTKKRENENYILIFLILKILQ
jgi:hypothetical protein